MAPKRKSDKSDGDTKAPAGKKAQAGLPSCDPRWKELKPSLLYRDNLEPCSKIAAIDLDGTLIVTRLDAPQQFGTNFELDSWEWWNSQVVGKLKARSSRSERMSDANLIIYFPEFQT
jgi:hypothetical protein